MEEGGSVEALEVLMFEEPVFKNLCLLQVSVRVCLKMNTLQLTVRPNAHPVGFEPVDKNIWSIHLLHVWMFLFLE